MATVRRLQLRFCSRPSHKGTAPQPQKWARFRGPKTGPQTAACEVSCELMWKRRSLNNLRFVSKIGSFWRPHFWGRQVFNILAKNPATGPPQAAIKQSSTLGFFIPAPVALEAQDSTKVSEKRRQLHCCQHDKSFLHHWGPCYPSLFSALISALFSDPAKNHNILNSLFKVAIYCGSTLMRTILVFFGTLLVVPRAAGFWHFPQRAACRWRPCFFFTRSSSEPAEPEQLSRLRGFASSGLCYTVPCATLSKGLTVEQCNTLFWK